MEKLKEKIKELLALLVILLAIAGIFYGKYAYTKNKKEKLAKYSAELTSQTREEINSTESTLWSRIKGGVGNFVHVDKSNENNAEAVANSEGNQNTLINFNVSGEYDSFVFDDRLLIYEGNQNGSYVKGALGIMIADITDDYYSNPKLTVKNVGGFEGTIEDDANYTENLNNVLHSIDNNKIYNVSFGYNKTKTIANEVIIEGK